MQYKWHHLPASFFISSLFITGIWWEASNHSWWAIICSIALISFFLLTQSNLPFQKVINILILIAAFLGGTIRHFQQQKSFDLFYATYTDTTCDIIGTICSIEQTAKTPSNSQLILQIKSTRKTNLEQWHNINAKIFIYTSHIISAKLQVDDTILIKKVKFKKSSNTSFNNFLIKQNCMTSLFLPSINYKLINRPDYSWKKWLWQYKNSLLSQLKEKFSIDSFRFFSAIFLGNPQEKGNLKNIRPYFKTWGITHYLARSGLHLIFFILLLQLLFGIIPLPFTTKQLAFIALTILYASFSWPSIPFNRALYIFVFQRIGKLLSLQTNTLHLLCSACLLTLYYNPIQLFYLDFQLSFGLTFALIHFNIFSLKNYC